MFLSDFLHKPVLNYNRETVGKISDLIASNLSVTRPAITGFIVYRGLKKKEFFIPVNDIENIGKNNIILKTNIINFSPFKENPGDIRVARDILDKQIVDVSERELTRTNDIDLTFNKGYLFIKSADVSFRSILHRLGLPTWGLVLKYNPIPWKDIQFMGTNLPVKVKMDYDRLETLHPAAIAEFIFKGPGVKEGTKIIQSLEEDIAADVVESMPLDMQVTLIEGMKNGQAATILSEMESHHAADLLARISPEKAQLLLAQIPVKNSRDIKTLLKFPEGSVGALMQAEYISLPAAMTVEEAQNYLKNLDTIPEFLLYFYITESAVVKKVVGVATIWDFIKAEPRARLEHIMEKDVVTVKPLEAAKKALKLMIQYDISAIPVVDDQSYLLGIVTLSHSVKLIVPKSWKTRATLQE